MRLRSDTALRMENAPLKWDFHKKRSAQDKFWSSKKIMGNGHCDMMTTLFWIQIAKTGNLLSQIPHPFATNIHFHVATYVCHIESVKTTFCKYHVILLTGRWTLVCTHILVTRDTFGSHSSAKPHVNPLLKECPFKCVQWLVTGSTCVEWLWVNIPKENTLDPALADIWGTSHRNMKHQSSLRWFPIVLAEVTWQRECPREWIDWYE